MRNQRLKDLINLDLDGRTTPGERLALARELEKDPQARALREDLEAVRQALDERAQVEPPENLRQLIAEQVDGMRRFRSSEPPDRPAAEKGRRVLQIALAAAAAIAFAFLLAPSLVQQIDPNQLRGTMAPVADGPPQLHPLPAPGIRGAIAIATEGGELVLRPELETTDGGRLEVRFDPRHLRFVSIRGGADLLSETGRVSTAFGGGNPPELRFARRSGDPLTLSVTVMTEGAPASSTAIHLPASTNFSN